MIHRFSLSRRRTRLRLLLLSLLLSHQSKLSNHLWLGLRYHRLHCCFQLGIRSDDSFLVVASLLSWTKQLIGIIGPHSQANHLVAVLI